MHHLCIAEAKHAIPAFGEHRVSSAVAFERRDTRVVLPAIDLNDDTSPDEKVDTADAGNEHLPSDASPEGLEPHPEESLDAGFTHPIQASMRMALGDSAGARQEPLMQRAVQRHRKCLCISTGLEI